MPTSLIQKKSRRTKQIQRALRAKPKKRINPDERISAILASAAAGLAALQEPGGAFPGIAASDSSMTEEATLRQTTFQTSLILVCLSSIPSRIVPSASVTAEAAAMAKKGARFLLKEKSDAWSWNYWRRGSEESRTLPYPDDIDDTFSALAAISFGSPQSIDGSALGAAVKLLLVAENETGGPYNTWLIDFRNHPEWRDIDPAVNANVAYFMALQGITIPSLAELVETAVSSQDFSSKYYFSPIAVLYFLMRAYMRMDSLDPARMSACKAKAGAYILARQNDEGHWGNPLETALAISAALDCGIPSSRLDRAIAYLMDLNEKNEEGIWKAYPLHIETAKNGNVTYAGSEALTTAFCVEALAKASRKQVAAPSDAFPPEALKIEKTVLSAFMKRFANIPSLRAVAEQVAAKVLERDPGKQIILLPYFFHRSLNARSSQERLAKEGLPKDFLVELGLANLSGWVAYRIFDDFLDNEGVPELIPLAAACLRDVSSAYAHLIPKELRSIHAKMMDGMDAANAWERPATYFPGHSFMDISHELPDYGAWSVLAEKSLPHCLGPLIILSRCGGSAADIRAAIAFFRHYLIARQLNDDAHDWLDDLRRGFVNSSAAAILKLWRIKRIKKIRRVPGETEAFEKCVPEFQNIFWREAIPSIISGMRAHIAEAHRALSRIKPMGDTAYLASLLKPLEKSADEASAEREKMIGFIAEYGKSGSQ